MTQLICGCDHTTRKRRGGNAFHDRRNPFFCILLGCGVALPCIGQAAEDKTHDRKLKTETIVVRAQYQHKAKGYVAFDSSTATKTDTPLREIPQSISVVTRQQMDDQVTQNVAQALRYTAGVYSEPRSDTIFDTTFMRGFGGFATSANYVGFLDGIQLQQGQGWAIPTVDPSTLDRVDVLRGPASVLYGDASPGGIINLDSKLPSLSAPRQVAIESGSRNRIQGTFDVGGALTSDQTLLYRVSGLGRRVDSQMRDAKEQRLALTPTLTWKATPRVSVDFALNVQRDPDNNFAGWIPAQGSVLPGPHGRISTKFNPSQSNYDGYNRTQIMPEYRVKYHFLQGWTLQQTARYEYLNTSFKGLAVNFSNPYDTDGNLNRYSSWSRADLNGVVADTRVEGHVTSGPLQHRILAGVTYDRSESSMRQSAYGLVSALDYSAPVYDATIVPPALAQSTRQDSQRIGGYIQDQIRFGHWSLLLGGRHDWLTIRTRDRLSDTTSTQNDSAFTGRAGLVYLFENGLSPYVSYSTSFQPVAGVDYEEKAFQPTRASQVEGGIKYQPVGYNSFLTVAAYDINERHVSTTDPAHPYYSVQRGGVRSWGVEFEAHAALTDNLGLIASYSYTDPTVTHDPDASLIGKRLYAVPRHMASLWANYAVTWGHLQGINVSGGVRYVGSSAGDETNSFTVPGVVLFDTTLRYDLSRLSPSLHGWSLMFNGTNLFDRKYVSSCFSAGGCFYGNRRMFKTAVSFRW